MIGLIHCELVLALLEVIIVLWAILLGNTVFNNLVDLDFVADAGWRLRRLHVVYIHMLLLRLVNVEFTTTGGSASRIRINTSYSLADAFLSLGIGVVSSGLTLYKLVALLQVSNGFTLGDVDAAAFCTLAILK